jgi:hypothetical protein
VRAAHHRAEALGRPATVGHGDQEPERVGHVLDGERGLASVGGPGPRHDVLV